MASSSHEAPHEAPHSIYTIVAFIMTESKPAVEPIQIVPSTWIIQNEIQGTRECRFPPDPHYEGLREMVKNQESYEEIWPVFPVRIMGLTDTYDKAEDDLKRLEVIQLMRKTKAALLAERLLQASPESVDPMKLTVGESFCLLMGHRLTPGQSLPNASELLADMIAKFPHFLDDLREGASPALNTSNREEMNREAELAVQKFFNRITGQEELSAEEVDRDIFEKAKNSLKSRVASFENLSPVGKAAAAARMTAVFQSECHLNRGAIHIHNRDVLLMRDRSVIPAELTHELSRHAAAHPQRPGRFLTSHPVDTSVY